MQIYSIEFDNKTSGQKIEKISFGKLNLLVGVSGAGKTQILKILSKCANIACGDRMVDFEGNFKIDFSVDDLQNKKTPIKQRIVWDVETVTAENDSELLADPPFVISKEVIIIDGKTFIQRDGKGLFVDGKQSSDIFAGRSVIATLSTKELDFIRINFIKMVSYNKQSEGLRPGSLSKNIKKKISDGSYKNLKDFIFKIIISRYPVLTQIYLVKKFSKNLFQNFLLDVQNVFPGVENINIFPGYKDELHLTVKENGKIIEQDELSSGLLKTIYIVAVTCFSSGNTAILVDELENGLGVNCIDEVTDYITQSSNESGIQFILTSHHPYIINKISEKAWKIISQENGVIHALSAQEVGIDSDSNRQDKFFQLINYFNG